MALTTEERDNAMPFLALEHGRLAVTAQGCTVAPLVRVKPTKKNRVRAELWTCAGSAVLKHVITSFCSAVQALKSISRLLSSEN